MDKNVTDAIKLVKDVVYSTHCPDPGFGGCMGGPVPGYGCLNEAATSALRRLEEGNVKEALEVLELIRSKTDGRIEITAAINLLRGEERQ